MNENWNVIEVLRHSRHDWLNRLQMIKGNLSLGKTEQALRVVDQIVMEMKQEARLSNLRLPKMAEMLLTHNWEKHLFRIEYEIMSECGSFDIDDGLVTDWLQSLFDCLDRASLPNHDNYLYLTMERQGDAVRFLFHYNGIIKNTDELNNWVLDKNQSQIRASLEQTDEGEWILEAIVH
ncbi:MAG TPA: Spo0B C-terminal domain-containing protein [Bacillaceae bacterium]